MKNKTADFSKMKRKICLQGIGMLFLAVAVVWVLYHLIWQGRAGTAIVNFLQRVFNIDYYRAQGFYQMVFRNYDFLWWIIFILGAFLILFFLFLNWFTRYFNEINRGIEELLEEGEGAIKLPEELSAVALKLNTVRNTLKHRADELKGEEQRKNDLVLYLAHDIKTPLTSVIGYLSLLNESPDMPMEQKAKYTKITLEKAYRLEELVNEFFEITRYNLQTIDLQKEKVDLYYLLMQMVDEFYPVTAEKKIKVNLTAEETLWVNGDPDKLARVFNNLLKNATAYSDADTEIQITAEIKEKQVIICISNQGQTIPEAKLASVFDKFYRLDQARSTNTGGAGLGLSIASEIVQLHNGQIKGESKNGITTFTVILPAEITS